MKYLALALALGLASCARHRTAPAPVAEPVHASTTRPDSAVVTPRRTVLDKVLGREPKPYTVKSTALNVGKKSTVAVYYGPATVTTTTVGKKATAATAEGAIATTVGKVKAPTAIGDSATATDNTKAGQRGGAAAIGKDASATATTQKSGWPWWLYVLLVGGGGLLVYRGYKRFFTV
jgi:hypothetical protein